MTTETPSPAGSSQPEQPGPAPMGAVEPARRRRFGTGARIATAGLALLAVGGAVAIADPLHMRDHQDSPALVLPADAIGYLAVDVDPSVGQKVEVMRFLAKFPSLKQSPGVKEDADVKKLVWDRIMADASTGCRQAVDYQADVKPWLGDQMGIAVRPGNRGPLVAVRASDEGKARAAMGKLQQACSQQGDETGVGYLDGYLVLGKDQKSVDDGVSAAHANALGRRAEFVEDFARVGAQGMVSAWGTGEGLTALTRDAADKGIRGTGRGIDASEGLRSGAAVLHFADGNPELRFAMKASRPLTSSAGTTRLGELPGDTTVALGVADGAHQVDVNWDQVKRSLEADGNSLQELQDNTHLNLPEDLKTLLGDDLRVALGPVDEHSFDSPSDLPLAVSSHTDKAKLSDVLSRTGLSDQGITVQGSQGDPVVSTGSSWAATLGGTGTTLGEQDGFRRAVDAPGTAQAIVYVDLAALEPLWGRDMPTEQKRDLEQLRSIGISSRTEQGDYQSGALRVVAR